MKRTVPLATSPKKPMTETIRPMMTKALGEKCSIIISCSLVQKGSPSSSVIVNKESLRSMRLAPSSTTPSAPSLLKFIEWTIYRSARPGNVMTLDLSSGRHRMKDVEIKRRRNKRKRINFPSPIHQHQEKEKEFFYICERFPFNLLFRRPLCQ